jgi:NTP pyrophosphatase (non-canonical NTP hydrolase)
MPNNPPRRMANEFAKAVDDLANIPLVNETVDDPAAPASSGVAPQEPQEEKTVSMSFEAFSRVNRERCESATGFNHQLDSWSTSDWFLAALGELGEAANIAKKLNRVRDGIPGNKVSPDELRAKLRQELGDVFVYLDLLAQSLGFRIGDAAVEVFNVKLAELNCPIRMASHD